MAGSAESSRMEAELTCAICLELFREPVTAPCGHNFCRDCLTEAWAGERRRLLGFSCPQCRTHFPERPELQPNRVLCAVVEDLECRLAKSPSPELPAAPLSVPCDACPLGAGASASRTCLTCLASFCPRHLEPHLESPAFRSHSLSPPLPDLAQRRCPQHGGLLDFYCRPHRVCICAACLLEHRGCNTQSLEEARAREEEELKTQQKNVRFQMIQMQHHLELVEYQKQQLLDSPVKQKLSSEFAEMKSLIEAEEKTAAKMIEEEETKATGQIDGVLERLGTQLTQLKQYKEQLDSALANTGSMVFWKNIAELPVISLDTSTLPKPMEINDRKVELVEKVVVTLKQALVQQMKCPLQQRMRQLEQAEKNKSKLPPGQTPKIARDAEPDPSCTPDQMEPSRTTDNPERKQAEKKRNKSKPSPSQTPKIATDEGQDSSCTPDHMEPSRTTDNPEGKQAEKKRNKSKPSPSQTPKIATDEGQDSKKTKSKPSPSQNQPSTPYKEGAPRMPLPIQTFALSRAELMHYNSKITYDHRTAHKKLVINDRFTVLSLADQPQSYPDQPERFFNCSQVLGLQSFTNGRHYWEVSNDGGSFWAIGIACVGMDRRGSRSRLGRNTLSWCVEGFGQKLSAWHGDRELVLNVQLPRMVGVFLDFAAGHVAFYSVSCVPMLLISYKTEFQSRVFPAFWLSSKDAKLTLVQ